MDAPNIMEFTDRRKNEPDFVRLDEAARRCSMSPQMLMKLKRMGQGPPVIRKGRALFFEVAALREWMRQDAA